MNAELILRVRHGLVEYFHSLGRRDIPSENPEPRDITDWEGQTSLCKRIDHTLLKPQATAVDVCELCDEAMEYDFASVCVNPVWVEVAAKRLENSSVAVCTVIGFPLGATLPQVKAYEARQALEQGAREVDMVINIGALLGGNYQLVYEDIKAVVEAVKGEALVKVIIESGLLSEEKKIAACILASAAGADFVKTSTGFSGGGATVEDVVLMRTVVGNTAQVKASGGIRDYPGAMAMIRAGADRLGTSSGVTIARGEREASV
ncbi:MAG: deoxyribose-phosphate aldolase [Firmicutes bacterium]|nr:deoxyribose-phosphate aldolase [Bacillota bacterium]